MNPALFQLEAAASELGIEIPLGALDRFDRYVNEILAWRTRINLTAASTAQQIVGLHFVDSLLPLVTASIPDGCRLIDVGTGAGLPGIPMKLMRPDLRVVLLDASRRRVAFLEHVRAALALSGLEIVWGRAEDIGHQRGFREGFDIAVTRATASLAASAEMCLPLVAPGGCAIFMKGPNVREELSLARPLIEALGGRIESAELRPLPTTGAQRAAVIVRKEGATGARFPRRGPRQGTPATEGKRDLH